MKILFGIVLIALSLIVKPVLADQAFKVNFVSIPKPSQAVTLVKLEVKCMLDSGPPQIFITPSIDPLDPIKSSIVIRDKNSGFGECWQREKRIIWNVFYGPQSGSKADCGVTWKTYTPFPFIIWYTEVATNCPYIKGAVCKDDAYSQDCLNKSVNMGQGTLINPSINITF
ncbi:hypothetical protein ACP179_05830 [Xenorhabdus stockiae]|uniref:hypothetical protein n=1 Tax=Xenorhabdus stockiae TaxID=351614 RepID=UPI003CEDBBF2